jgi:IS4 transposase
MECKCVQEIEKQVVGTMYKERRISHGRFMDSNIVFTPGRLMAFTSSRIEVTLDGVKRNQVLSINHNFCPFCGTQISKPSREAVPFVNE